MTDIKPGSVRIFGNADTEIAVYVKRRRQSVQIQSFGLFYTVDQRQYFVPDLLIDRHCLFTGSLV